MRLWIILLLSSVMSYAENAQETIIAIQPLGAVNQQRLDIAKKGLEDAFGMKVVILDVNALPKEAWYEPRKRYRAEKLLTYLGENTSVKHRIVVGLTSKDISTTKEKHEDWGVFGLGELQGRTCVISTFRLGARGANEEKLRERLRKVTIHEVGHVIGLQHCPQKGCVMQDAESSITTVDGEDGRFCEICKTAIR